MMLLKNGLMLMLSLASVSGQIIDCTSSTNDSSSDGFTENAASPLDCPLDGPTEAAQNSTQISANNETLFQILNSTNSPVPQFMTLITSSPEFAPLIDILSKPANHTIFLPCDEALASLISMTNSTQNNETSPSSTSNGTISQIQLVSGITMRFNRRDDDGNSENQTTVNPDNTNASPNNTTEVISQGLGNFSLIDILKYHIINGSWPIENITHGVYANDTLMSNKTAYPLGLYVPLVINNTITIAASNQTSTNNSTDSTNQTTAIVDQHFTLLADNDTNTTTHNNITSNFTVGNGIGFANLVVADITGSNGIIHIIDKVLVPPVSTVSAIEQLNETKVNDFLSNSSNTSSLLNSANNVTIFLPSDEALQNYTRMNGGSQMDIGTGENDNNTNSAMDQLIRNHIVNGTYYTSNFTTSPLNVTTLDGNQLQLNGTGNGTSFKVGNATIIKSDVLTNRAVVMVIDQVLQSNRTISPTSSPTSSPTQTESATSTTSIGLSLTPSSLIHILGTSLISLLIWSMVLVI